MEIQPLNGSDADTMDEDTTITSIIAALSSHASALDRAADEYDRILRYGTFPPGSSVRGLIESISGRLREQSAQMRSSEVKMQAIVTVFGMLGLFGDASTETKEDELRCLS